MLFVSSWESFVVCGFWGNDPRTKNLSHATLCVVSFPLPPHENHWATCFFVGCEDSIDIRKNNTSWVIFLLWWNSHHHWCPGSQVSLIGWREPQAQQGMRGLSLAAYCQQVSAQPPLSLSRADLMLWVGFLFHPEEGWAYLGHFLLPNQR